MFKFLLEKKNIFKLILTYERNLIYYIFIFFFVLVKKFIYQLKRCEKVHKKTILLSERVALQNYQTGVFFP